MKISKIILAIVLCVLLSTAALVVSCANVEDGGDRSGYNDQVSHIALAAARQPASVVAVTDALPATTDKGEDICPELTPGQVGRDFDDIQFIPYASYAEENILFGRTWSPGYFDSTSDSMAVVRIHSAEELHEAFGNPMGSWNLTDDFTDKDFAAGWQCFDHAFFSEHSLVVLMLERGSGSIRHRVDGVSADSGSHRLTVQLTTEYPDIQTCDMAYWFIFLPVDKQADNLDVVIQTVDLYESDVGSLMR